MEQQSLTLNEDQKRQIYVEYQKLVPLYQVVKVLVIASEKIDSDQKLSVSAINELRNAFDHDMRVKAVLFTDDTQSISISGMLASEYCVTNINKAVGHIYRAGYDALDVISLRFVEDIDRLKRDIHLSSFLAVFPDYHREIKAPFERGTTLCDEAKAFKDVECSESLTQYFGSYKEGIEELRSVYRALSARLPEVMVIEDQFRKDNEFKLQQAERQARLGKVYGIVGVMIGIIGILISIFK